MRIHMPTIDGALQFKVFAFEFGMRFRIGMVDDADDGDHDYAESAGDPKLGGIVRQWNAKHRHDQKKTQGGAC